MTGAQTNTSSGTETRGKGLPKTFGEIQDARIICMRHGEGKGQPEGRTDPGEWEEGESTRVSSD